MLPDIVTGYESDFDFPFRHNGPSHVYMLASTPRSGSTLLSHLLWQSGCLGVPLEYLNFVPQGPYSFAHQAPLRQTQQWRTVLQRRTSPNGVFGIKCFPLQLRELQQENPSLLTEVLNLLLLRNPNPRIVRLKRRDRVAHSVSFARAALSGVWRKEQETNEAQTVEYSKRAVEHARALLDQAETEWDRLFGELGVQPLTLWHEDTIQNPAGAVRAVASFLGITLEPAAAISVPQVEKQSEADAQHWMDQYTKAAK